MKKDNLGYILLMFILMIASFYAGFSYSPNNNNLLEKEMKIKELKETIVQQQVSNFYIIKHMKDFQVKNWSMNKNK